MTQSDSKAPAAPASPDSNRLRTAPYHPVLAGQPALVTGANSSIGKAVALGLARAGADLIVNYVTYPETADAVVTEIEALGRRAVAVQADVSKEEDVERMFAAAIAHFGTLHIVVSNAGLQRDSAFTEMTLEQWNTVIGVNLTGPVPLHPCRSPRVHATRCCRIRLCRSGENHLLGRPSHRKTLMHPYSTQPYGRRSSNTQPGSLGHLLGQL